MCSTSKSEYTFFAEFLPRVGVYQLSFSHADNCRLIISPRGVVKSGLRHSEGVEEEEICKWPPHLPDLVPGSFLDPLKLAPAKSEPLQLRFRSSGPPLAEFERILDPPDFAPSLRSALFVVRCGFCGNALTRRNYHFKRVLPLPSDEWLEIAGDAFCHLHTPSPSHTLTPHTLTPREGDCLTSGRVIRVMSECVRGGAVDIIQGVIHCRRCYLELGETVESSTSKRAESVEEESPERKEAESKGAESKEAESKGAELKDRKRAESKESDSVALELLRSRLSFDISSAPSLPPPPSFWGSGEREKERYLAQLLCSASRDKSSYKFTVQDHSGRVYIYVWMLNVASHVIYKTHHMTSHNLSSKFTGVAASHSHSYPALKLLYMVAMETDHAPWSRDSSEPLPLSREECLWVWVVLGGSTHSLPPPQRRGRGAWKVGYLCLQ